MPKKTPPNDYLTKKDLKPYATNKDLEVALERYVTKHEFHEFRGQMKDFQIEMRTMFDELTKTMTDHFNLLYKEIQDVKLIQTQHTREIDQHTIDIADLQQDVGLLQTLNTI